MSEKALIHFVGYKKACVRGGQPKYEIGRFQSFNFSASFTVSVVMVPSNILL